MIYTSSSLMSYWLLRRHCLNTMVTWSSAVKIKIFETNTLLLNIVAIVLASVIVHTKFMLSCSCDVPSLWSQPMMLINALCLWYFLHNVQINYILPNLLCCVVITIVFCIIFCKRHFKFYSALCRLSEGIINSVSASWKKMVSFWYVLTKATH